jgi:hypothetical protein
MLKGICTLYTGFGAHFFWDAFGRSLNWYQSRYRRNHCRRHGMGLRSRGKWWESRGSNPFIEEWQLPWLLRGRSLLLSCLYMIMCWNGCHDNKTILGAFYMT